MEPVPPSKRHLHYSFSHNERLVYNAIVLVLKLGVVEMASSTHQYIHQSMGLPSQGLKHIQGGESYGEKGRWRERRKYLQKKEYFLTCTLSMSLAQQNSIIYEREREMASFIEHGSCLDLHSIAKSCWCRPSSQLLLCSLDDQIVLSLSLQDDGMRFGRISLRI